MRMRKLFANCAVLGVAAVLALAGATALADAPKNVIVMISDGCGYNHIEATDYYMYDIQPHLSSLDLFKAILAHTQLKELLNANFDEEWWREKEAGETERAERIN